MYSRFCLEFDWAFYEHYLSLADGMLSSIVWRNLLPNEADLAIQGEQVFSCFDSMDPEKRAAITLRYREILGRSPAKPAEELTLLDLRECNPGELDLASLEESLAHRASDQKALLLAVPLFPEPIEVTFDLEELAERELSLLLDLAQLDSEALERASELLWEHCKLCFEVTDYGAEEESNESYFNIHGPEDAWRERGKASLYLGEENRELKNRICALQFYPVWEDEHGCSLVLRNGEFLAWTEQCPCLEDFDDEN